MSEKWIPVADGLPERKGFYWVTIQNGGDRYVMSVPFFAREWGLAHPERVVAWKPMEPIPEPYQRDVKEGQDESR